MRKLREAVLTHRLERDLTKARILELYLNIAEWGPGVYGADAAAQRYFNKSAAELRLSEAVRLAAVLPNPRQLSPLDSTVLHFCAMCSAASASGFLETRPGNPRWAGAWPTLTGGTAPRTDSKRCTTGSRG